MNFIFLIKKFFCLKFYKKKFICKNHLFFKKKIRNLQLSPDDIFIIDTLGIDTNLSNLLNKFKIKKRISFDELNKKRLTKGIVINGIYFTKKNKIIEKY